MNRSCVSSSRRAAQTHCSTTFYSHDRCGDASNALEGDASNHLSFLALLSLPCLGWWQGEGGMVEDAMKTAEAKEEEEEDFHVSTVAALRRCSRFRIDEMLSLIHISEPTRPY